MVWNSKIIDWKNSQSWCPALSSWIKPYLNIDGIKSLRRMGYQDICWDDSAWLEKLPFVTQADIDFLTRQLSEDIKVASVRTYHGCCVADASTYHRSGILLNNPENLADQVRELVNKEDYLEHLRSKIDDIICDFEDRDRDRGQLYLALDDRSLISSAGHYLLYGSEWIMCLFGAEDFLRNRGIPTILSIQLPLALVTSGDRGELATALIQEWVRIQVNSPEETPEKDFTFCLKKMIPPEMIISHYHPKYVYDWHHRGMRRDTKQTTCPSCTSC